MKLRVLAAVPVLALALSAAPPATAAPIWFCRLGTHRVVRHGRQECVPDHHRGDRDRDR